jgi:hypothetical protein
VIVQNHSQANIPLNQNLSKSNISANLKSSGSDFVVINKFEIHSSKSKILVNQKTVNLHNENSVNPNFHYSKWN